MKTPLKTGVIVTLSLLVLAACIAGLWWQRAPAVRLKASTGGADVAATAPLALAMAQAESAPAEGNMPAAAPVAEPIAVFADWMQRYLAATKQERTDMAAEGIVLAQARRPAFKKLIVDDPRAAMANAVPMVARQQMPPEVLAHLERRVHETADVEVQAVSPGSDPAEPVARWFTRFGGEELRTYVYGRRSAQNSLYQVPVHGVAVDQVMALAESPLRVLENGEIPPADAVREEKCPVSGLTTRVEEPAAPVTETTPAVQVGTTVVYLCEGGHIRVFEEELIAAEGGTGGATGITAPAPSAFANGTRTLLYMRLAFPDDQQEPQTEAAAWEAIRQLNAYFQEISYGKIFYLAAVPPLIVLPRTETWYASEYTATGSNSPIMNDAKDAARRMGYNPDNFQHFTVIYTGGPGSFGGLGSVGGSNVWLRSTSLGVFAHEIGHNTGVWHGNFWNTSGRDVTGGGANAEYGNSYDVMGSSGSVSGYKGHFMSPHKNQLGWLTNEQVTTVTNSGQFRIYPMDQTVLDPALRYGLKIAKDADRDYWVELRQKYNNDHRWFRDGVVLSWSSWGQSVDNSIVGSNRGGQFLDTTPGSADGKNDGPVVIGRTFSDHESGVHITPVAKGGTTPESMDVVVNVGDFPGNSAPVINLLTASTTTPAANQAVTFTVDATDPDGDPLAYFWDYGDATYGSNEAMAVKLFTSIRHHAVRCIVSDMKGGETSKLMLITVGSPPTFTATGRIVDEGGNPVPEVRVQNGSSGTSFRGAWTDSNGDFVVTNLAAGAVTLTPVRGAHAFSPANRALTLGPNATAVDFTAVEPVRLTVEALDAEADETGSNDGAFRLTRTGSTTGTLVVYADLQGDAATSDYTLNPAADTTSTSPVEQFTLPAGAASLDIVVTPANDTTREGPETLRMVLIPRTTYTITGKASASVTITDTGTNNVANRMTVVAVDADADEAGGTGMFDIRRAGPVDNPLNVAVTLAGATNTAAATNGADFSNITTPVTIPAGEASAQVMVTPVNDSAVEGQETVQLTVSGSSLYGVGTPSSAIVRIADDDIPTVSITATEATAAEGGTDTGLFTISRMGSTVAPLVVDYVIGGSALHGTDYLALPGTVTIPAGASDATILITPVDDTHGEPAQTVVLQLRNDPRLLLSPNHTATVTISDNDLSVVAVGVSDNTCNEPNATGSFRITTTGSGSGNITVRYTISGTATSGTDFTAPSGAISMGKNTTSTVTVTPLNDSLLEDAETVTLTLTPDPAYQVDVLQPASTLTIRDDDHPSTVSAAFSALTMSENNGTAKLFFSRVTSTGSSTTAGALNIAYHLGGTATSGADYTGLDGMATIADGSSNVSVTVTGVNDSLREGAEKLEVNLLPGSYSIQHGTASVTITDDETTGFDRTAAFATRSTVRTEGDAPFIIPVVLSSADPDNEVRVDYIIDTNSATGSGVDTDLVAGTLVFPPGSTQQEIPASIVDDMLPEMEEHLTLKLAFATGAALANNGAYHTLFIRDNEPRVRISVTRPVGYEQNGAPAGMILTRTGPVAAALSVSLGFSGTATPATDHTAIPAAVSIPSGQRSLVLPVTPLPDAAAEGTETVGITLLPSSKYTISGTGSAEVAILDSGTDHPPTVRIISPVKAEVALSSSTGILLSAEAFDDGAPGSVTVVWSKQSGPGTVTFGDPSAAATAARFSAAGRHVLRCTATDAGLQTGFAEVTVIVSAGAALWAQQDIGITGTSATGAGDVRDDWVQNQGSGSSITGTSDSFRFVHAELDGDGEIVARFEGVDGAFSNSRLGLMMRDGTAANARYAAVNFQSTGTLYWNYRSTTDSTPGSVSATMLPGPRWLRVTRAGNVFTGHHSTDGASWTQIGAAQTLTLPAKIRAGIAVTSATSARPARGLFSQVRLTGLASNKAPFADAAPAATVQSAAFKQLTGIVNDDAQPAEMTTTSSWSQLSGPAAAIISGSTDPNATVQFPAEGTYDLRLTADDGEVQSFDDVQVQVQFATLGISTMNAAQEHGAVDGLISITRTGPTDMPLTVHYTTGGTADAGDYVALPGMLVIPAGETSAQIAVSPQADSVAEGDETVEVTLVAGPTYHLPVSLTAALVLQDEPLDAWRVAQFGTDANNPLVAGLMMDGDHDGWINLLEYAFGLTPTQSDGEVGTVETVSAGPDRFLRYILPKNPEATDLDYEVQATGDLATPASWSSDGLIIESNTSTQLIVRDNVPVGSGVRRFMRALVTKP